MSEEEDLVERYSKKYGIPREEAEKRLKWLLNDEGKKKVPSLDNLFPEPVGELSKKVQDVNQALLSSAYTRRLLDAPPEDVAALRARIENLDRIVGDLKSGLEDQIRRITEVLEDKQRKETREELLKELDSKMDPLRQTLQKLTEKLENIEKGGGGGGVGGGVSQPPEKILEEAERVANKARSWLQKQGYRVEPERLSRETAEGKA